MNSPDASADTWSPSNYKDFGNPLLFPPTAATGIIVVRMPKSSVRAGHPAGRLAAPPMRTRAQNRARAWCP